MSIVQTIKTFLSGNNINIPTNKPAFDDSDFDVKAYMAPFEASLAEKFTNVEIDGKKLSEHYGNFTNFICRQNFNEFLREDVLPFREPESKYLEFLNTDHWKEKHPYNFPGPFYVGQSDSCGTGIGEAPNNVMNDFHACDYIFRQPTNYYDLLCVLDAAAVEVFSSYSSNGNECWTYEGCKKWWNDREYLLNDLTNDEVVKMNNGRAHLYIDYLKGEAEMDLRRYCYFLENGKLPMDKSLTLPEL